MVVHLVNQAMVLTGLAGQMIAALVGRMMTGRVQPEYALQMGGKQNHPWSKEKIDVQIRMFFVLIRTYIKKISNQGKNKYYFFKNIYNQICVLKYV